MPNDPPPDPSYPPDGTYTSACGTNFSSWDGSFTYTNDNNNKGTIVYTLNGQTTPLPSTNNTDNGNAINFSLTYGGQTVKFNGSTFEWKGPNNNKAEYKGKCHLEGATDDLDGWTASQ
jgi:hypothetical protein